MDQLGDRGRAELRPVHLESVPAERAVSEPKPEPERVTRTAISNATATERRRLPDADAPDHHAAAAVRLPDAESAAAPNAALVPGVAAIALIRDERGRVLLVKQTGGPFAGSWLLPGGRAGEDESAVHALVREVREETGLTMTDAVYVTGYRTSGDGYELTVLLYRGPATGTLVPERGSDARWFEVDAIPDPHPALRRELLDAGVGDEAASDVEAALAAAGIGMAALG